MGLARRACLASKCSSGQPDHVRHHDVLVAILFAFFRYSRMGLAMRAVAFDQEVALAQGVSVGFVFALSWAIAGALATVAGCSCPPAPGSDQQLWIIALKALPVIILGGLDSLAVR